MTNEVILKKAIEKAVGNGWNFSGEKIIESFEWNVYSCGDGSLFLEWGDSLGMEEISLYDTIFSHSFAKAFWGEKDYWHDTKCTCGGVGIHISDDTHDTDCKRVKCKRGFKFHLQQLVLEPEPLKYLEKFL